MAHNTHAKATHHYNVVDDLAQSPTAMSTLEVLKIRPSQKSALLTTLGAIELLESHMMTFDIDRITPQFPSLVAFQISITIKNIYIYCCVTNEGISTCVMPPRFGRT